MQFNLYLFYLYYLKIGSAILNSNMKLNNFWKMFLILLALSLLSTIAVLPYVLTLQANILSEIKLPLMILIPVQFLQSAIIFSIAIFLGLKLAKKVDFHLPVLEAVIAKKEYKNILRDIVPISIILGAVTAIIIYFTDILFSSLGAVITTHVNPAPIWTKLLAAFYGGISEEIFLRLFLMTLFVFLGMKILKQVKPGKGVIITSIILSAAIFGLGHLPITASLTSITPLVIGRAVVLNGIGGIIFGYLYWKKGLESAMIAHFTADVFLLTLLPFILG